MTHSTGGVVGHSCVTLSMGVAALGFGALALVGFSMLGHADLEVQLGALAVIPLCGFLAFASGSAVIASSEYIATGERGPLFPPAILTGFGWLLVAIGVGALIAAVVQRDLEYAVLASECAVGLALGRRYAARSDVR